MAIQTESEFIELVRSAERDAREHPRRYVARLALFAVLGYVVIFSILATLIGITGGTIAMAFFSTGAFLLLLKKKVIFVLLGAIWVLLRALWVRFDEPEGYELKRSQYPELYAELDRLSTQLKALRIHKVLLEENLNAGVVQHPRLGVLGWNKNILFIGLQILLILPPDEMRAVLAHEFGHLSGNHSRFSAWIYRVRQSWGRVMQAFDDTHSWSGALMRRFFDWYSPYFQAYSFVQARQNEYDADAIAADLTSPETAVGALVNIRAVAPHIDKAYWAEYYALAEEQPQPPYMPFTGLEQFLRENSLNESTLLERIDEEMKAVTLYADTHPCLKDRVDAIGAKPHLSAAPSVSAARAWLGGRYNDVLREFDERWLERNREPWAQRNAYVSEARAQLDAWADSDINELNDNDLWQFACWTQEFKTDREALPLFRAFQQRWPDDPDPAFYIGRYLLEAGDASGLDELKRARKSAGLIEHAAQAGYAFLKSQGRDDDAEQWWQDSIEENREFIEARDERASVTTRDTFTAAEIDPELRQLLVESFKRHKNVAKVWLAQKCVKHDSFGPVYVAAFSPKGMALSTDTLQKKVVESIAVPVDLFIVCKSGDNAGLAKKVIKAGTRIV